jgi:formylglycine-generating enzyme required for sulfatase activity
VENSPEFQAEKTGKARGLQIFNIDTKCVETWNGEVWIQNCPTRTSVPVFEASSCGVNPTGGVSTTFTCIEDPNVVEYEWFVSGEASSTITAIPSVTYETAKTASDITVRYLFEPSVLLPKMIAIEGGQFTIGAATNISPAVSNSHIVHLSRFSMSETPITQAQFSAIFSGIGISSYYKYNFCCGVDVDYAPSSAKPAENVTWYAAIAFCNKLSIKEGKTPCYSVKTGGTTEVDWANISYAQLPPTGFNNTYWDAATCNFSANGYRLPTEAEWEYAARGGQLSLTNTGANTTDYTFSGSDILDDVAWYKSNIPSNTSGTAGYGTQAVMQKTKNALGLYDMSGNIWEWCWDWYASYSSGEVTNPTGPSSGSERVLRGGSYYSGPGNCQVAYRDRYSPVLAAHYYGFRVVCSAN